MNITIRNVLSQRPVEFPLYKVLTASQSIALDASTRSIDSFAQIFFRYCKRGEYFDYGNISRSACVTCPWGKQSVKNNTDNAITYCNYCPRGSKECYADQIVLYEGTWRLSAFTSAVFYCKYLLLCLPIFLSILALTLNILPKHVLMISSLSHTHHRSSSSRL
jgi:hypothetical protein